MARKMYEIDITEDYTMVVHVFNIVIHNNVVKLQQGLPREGMMLADQLFEKYMKEKKL